MFTAFSLRPSLNFKMKSNISFLLIKSHWILSKSASLIEISKFVQKEFKKF